MSVGTRHIIGAIRLTEPMVSISRTVLKALAERPEMGEMKFPAAPALKSATVSTNPNIRLPWILTSHSQCLPILEHTFQQHFLGPQSF